MDNDVSSHEDILRTNFVLADVQNINGTVYVNIHKEE